jgi:hypothetical protein
MKTRFSRIYKKRRVGGWENIPGLLHAPVRLLYRIACGVGLRPRYGADYAIIGPVPVFQCYNVAESLFRMGESLGRGGASVLPLLPSHPEAMSPLLHHITLSPLSVKNVLRATTAQVVACYDALYECNDVDYIIKFFTPEAKEGEGEYADTAPPKVPSLALLIHRIVQECPCYTHRKVLELPMQEAIQILDCMEYAEGGTPTEDPSQGVPGPGEPGKRTLPQGARELTMEERQAVLENLRSSGCLC